jgi:hypothetical protein
MFRTACDSPSFISPENQPSCASGEFSHRGKHICIRLLHRAQIGSQESNKTGANTLTEKPVLVYPPSHAAPITGAKRHASDYQHVRH